MSNTTPPPQVRVGVGVFVLQSPNPPDPKNPSFLVGKRIGSHGANTLALPGGHLEFGESFEQCAAREVKEETGLDVKNLSFLTATNDIMLDEGRHYVTVMMVCERCEGEGEARVMETEKCEGWEWWTWEGLRGVCEREGVFLPLRDLVRTRPDLIPSLR